MSCDMDNDAPYYCTENGAARCREKGWHITCKVVGQLYGRYGSKVGVEIVTCDVSHYHKLSFSQLYKKLRYGLHKAEWADNDNPTGLPTSSEYENAIKCYLSFYTFDNTIEPFYHRVLTGQYGKRSPKVYAAIARYLTFGLE